MSTFIRRFVPALLVAGLAWSVTTEPALAQSARNWDAAGLFSRDAKARAQEKIARIKDRFKVELAYETVESVKLAADAKDKAAVNKEIDSWALSRFKMQGHTGIYVVITKEPSKIRVVHANRLKKVFGGAEANHLEKIVEKHLIASRKDPAEADKALLEGVDYVYTTLESRMPAGATKETKTTPAKDAGARDEAEPRVNWVTWLLIGVGAFLVIWLILGLVRGLSGAGGGAGAPGYGGGGFFSSFLAGMFGAAAGMWMYNTFFGGHSSSAYGAGPGDTGYGSTDGGASVTGGDWGDDGGASTGGGDWGGDVGGGGDWGGGGDFGGGDW